MQKTNLKAEIAGAGEDIHDEVAKRLMAVAQMQTVCEVFMAEIEDILDSMGQYRYTIKREHKKIVEMVQKQYANIGKILNSTQLDGFTDDNLRLQDFIRIWVGLDKEREAFIRDKDDTDEYTMNVNPVGDIYLRDKQGWIVTIPKSLSINMVDIKSYSRAKQKGIPVRVSITICEKKEEDT